jgi:hypothetical protein
MNTEPEKVQCLKENATTAYPIDILVMIHILIKKKKKNPFEFTTFHFQSKLSNMKT